MKKAASFIRFQILILLILLFTPDVIPQVNTTGSVQSAVPLNSSSVDSSKALYAGLGYGSNMIYLGSTISRNQPFGYTSLVYGFNEEFFISASAFHLAEINPFLAFTSFSMNYSHIFTSWFDVSLGLYRYQVAKTLTETLFNHFTYADISLGFDWRLIYTNISAGGLFSGESQGFLQLKNSRYFQTEDVFKGKANVSFDPYVNLLFGNLIKTKTLTDTIYTVTAPYRPWGSNIRSSTSTITNFSKTFNLIEIEFGLPVALNFDFMTIQAEASYVLPGYSDKNYPGSEGFVFLLSGFFRIF